MSETQNSVWAVVVDNARGEVSALFPYTPGEPAPWGITTFPGLSRDEAEREAAALQDAFEPAERPEREIDGRAEEEAWYRARAVVEGQLPYPPTLVYNATQHGSAPEPHEVYVTTEPRTELMEYAFPWQFSAEQWAHLQELLPEDQRTPWESSESAQARREAEVAAGSAW